MVLYLIGLGLLALMQVGDICTTNLVISQGGHEDNPVLKALMGDLGADWRLAKAGFAGMAIIILLLVGPGVLSWLVLVGLLAAYAWVISHNWGVAQRQKARRRK